MMNSGSIIYCPVTAKDISRAIKIYGPDLAAIRGKSRKLKITSSPIEYLPREVSSNLILNVDIMFVNSLAFLISVSTPLGLTIVNELGRNKGARSLASVSLALLEQLHTYASKKINITTIRADNEGSIAAMKSILNEKGITLNPSGAGSHVPDIERKIQEVKQRVRAVINSLPYRLARTLLAFLVCFCVSRINLVPHKTGLINISPSEAFRGRKADYKRDLRVGFGEYCEVLNANTNNTMPSRTQATISLDSVDNTTGSVILSLLSGKNISRDQFKILPMPDLIIDHMNNMADLHDESPVIVSMNPANESQDDINNCNDPHDEYSPDPNSDY
jgi:hypothetical protein